MDSVTLECRADDDKVVVSDTVRKHILVIAVNDDIQAVVLVVGLLEVLDEGVVRLETRLL